MATKKHTSASKRTFNSYRTVTHKSAGKTYVYPLKDINGRTNVPPNQYSAVINKIEPSVTSFGDNSLDVFYTLQNKNGDTYYVRQRIPENTNLMDNFLNFLVNSGVNTDKVCLEGFSGPVDPVYVTYSDDPTKVFGSVVYSPPYVSNHKPKKASSMEELLSEDDEDEVEPDEDEPELDEETIEEYLEEEE